MNSDQEEEHAHDNEDIMSPQYQNVGAAATAASVATILSRLEELSRRVAVLETGLTADVRRILQLLQAREAPLHNTQAAHTPSQPLPKPSLSVPHSNENQWEWNWNGDRERGGRGARAERTPGVQRSASEPHAPVPPALPPPPHSHSFYR